MSTYHPNYKFADPKYSIDDSMSRYAMYSEFSPNYVENLTDEELAILKHPDTPLPPDVEWTVGEMHNRYIEVHCPEDVVEIERLIGRRIS